MTEDEQKDQAASEESVEETPADRGHEAEESQPAEDEAPEALAEDAATEDDEAAEGVVEDSEGVVAEVEVEVVEEPRAKEKKADVIPGADLEPIAVEEEERPLSAEEQARLEAEEEERARREAALTGEAVEGEEDRPAPRAPAKLEGDARYLATGKRKRAIARVILLPGSGEIIINKRPLEEFFPRPLHQTMARQPLATTGYEGSVDVRVRVHGGGIGGQAGAVRHGIARALTEVDPELRSELKRRGFLTRDARVKERRKAGLKKARKRPQFSKR
jgi:small subunit ribosomal protein S9